MAMTEIKPKKVLDHEWVILMRAAQKIGLQKEEVRSFLRQEKEPTSTNVHKG
ncbi:anti-repressor SinI family protein [Guptibacillus spartinae]|uniref:anti-repressor SinI family protein n=1 Tax=Guptibacillus spartinae TaxID=3025679 RepID=UPI0023613E9C|nr:anti-repressor SinI family protein [Pseudalkalibacillus spartinae]